MTTYPALLLVFNRPEFAHQLAKVVAASQPPVVYVASDGPRNEDERRIVEETRDRVLTTLVNAGVETRDLLRDQNLGCKRAVEEAIDWFFSSESAGSILEDDCHPSESFFEFCDLMLDRYRDDERVMHIAGYSQTSAPGLSYRFSRFPAIWGWATWARAWQHHPSTIPELTPSRVAALRSAFARTEHADYFLEKWKSVQRGALDTWDFSWVYAVRSQNALGVQPEFNLVRNVGMGDARAAHTTRPDESVTQNMARRVDLSTLQVPEMMLPDDDADRQFFRTRIAGRLPRTRALYRRAKSTIQSG